MYLVNEVSSNPIEIPIEVLTRCPNLSPSKDFVPLAQQTLNSSNDDDQGMVQFSLPFAYFT